MIEEFPGGLDSKAAEARFRAWLDENPEGFYINVRKSKAPMLHRSSCGHIDAGLIASESLLTDTRKVCSQERAVLESWARSNGASLEPCSTCRP